jgi:hypothetical protein
MIKERQSISRQAYPEIFGTHFKFQDLEGWKLCKVQIHEPIFIAEAETVRVDNASNKTGRDSARMNLLVSVIPCSTSKASAVG